MESKDSTPVESYQLKVHEGIAKEIVKLLFMKKMKKNLKKAEEMIDDKEFKSTIDSIRYNYNKLSDELKYICRRNPEIDLCKDDLLGKANFRW